MKTKCLAILFLSMVGFGCGDKDDSGTAGTASECGSFNDTRSFFGDVQYDSLCWEAGNQRSCDEHDNADEICSTLQDFLDATGGGNANECDYC